MATSLSRAKSASLFTTACHRSSSRRVPRAFMSRMRSGRRTSSSAWSKRRSESSTPATSSLGESPSSKAKRRNKRSQMLCTVPMSAPPDSSARANRPLAISRWRTPVAQFGGGLDGERRPDDPGRIDALRDQHPFEFLGQPPGLAAAGPGADERDVGEVGH